MLSNTLIYGELNGTIHPKATVMVAQRLLCGRRRVTCSLLSSSSFRIKPEKSKGIFNNLKVLTVITRGGKNLSLFKTGNQITCHVPE